MITPDLQSVPIVLRPGVTDMRKQANGLSIVVEESMEENPGSGSLYLFCNREKKLLKCLWWDRNGFWLAHDWRRGVSLGRALMKRPEVSAPTSCSCSFRA